MSEKADLIIPTNTSLLKALSSLASIPLPKSTHCILVDECQFLDPDHIDDLRYVVSNWGVPVIAYGLRTDFRRNLFPASKRLW